MDTVDRTLDQTQTLFTVLYGLFLLLAAGWLAWVCFANFGLLGGIAAFVLGFVVLGAVAAPVVGAALGLFSLIAVLLAKLTQALFTRFRSAP